jgi:hypothetical protein
MASKETAQLVEKWSNKKGKMSVKGIKDQYIKENMAVLLENQETKNLEKELIFETARGTNTTTSTGANDTTKGAFQPITLALVRRTFPDLFANKVVGVQAMTGPVGLAYALRFLYDTDPTAPAGPKVEAAFNDVGVYSGFSGSQSGTSGTADTGTGVATATGEGMGIGDTIANGRMPELKLELDQTAITAKTRKLASSFSLESAQDIKAMHGVEVEREMVNVLQYEIQAELDRELIYKMKDTAVNGTGGAAIDTVTMSAVDGRWQQERFSSITTSIVKQANYIATATRRGAGNFVIVSTNVATALQAAGPQFSRNQAVVNATNSLTEIGTINGTIKVYLDSYANIQGATDYALVGYKGPGISDSGIIYSPYITGLMNRAVAQEDFSPRVGVMSRYAITDNLLGSGRYYRLINFQGLSDII